MTWTWGCTIIERTVKPYGWVPLIYPGLDLPCVTPAWASVGVAWQWAPMMGYGYQGTIRAARLMARCRGDA